MRGAAVFRAGLILVLLAGSSIAVAAPAGATRPARTAGLLFSYDRLVHRSHARAGIDLDRELGRLWRRLLRLPGAAPTGADVAIPVPGAEAERLLRFRSGWRVAAIDADGVVHHDRVTGFELQASGGDRPLVYFTTANKHDDGRLFVLARSEKILGRALAPVPRSPAPPPVAESLLRRLAKFYVARPALLSELLRACFCFKECPCLDFLDAACGGDEPSADPEVIDQLRHNCVGDQECACGALIAAVEDASLAVDEEFRRIIRVKPWRVDLAAGGRPGWLVQGSGPQEWLRFVAVFQADDSVPLVIHHADLEQMLRIRGEPYLLLNRFEPGTGARAAVLYRLVGRTAVPVFADESYSD